jgi:hypothetical protein
MATSVEKVNVLVLVLASDSKIPRMVRLVWFKISSCIRRRCFFTWRDIASDGGSGTKDKGGDGEGVHLVGSGKRGGF